MPTGLTKDAGWQAGASRTLPWTREQAWEVLTSSAGLAAWLGRVEALPAEVGQPYRTTDGTTGELRSLRPLDRVRLTWRPAGRRAPATLQVALSDGARGTVVRLHADRLDDAAEREQVLARFASALDVLAGLGEPAGPTRGAP